MGLAFCALYHSVSTIIEQAENIKILPSKMVDCRINVPGPTNSQNSERQSLLRALDAYRHVPPLKMAFFHYVKIGVMVLCHYGPQKSVASLWSLNHVAALPRDVRALF